MRRSCFYCIKNGSQYGIDGDNLDQPSRNPADVGIVGVIKRTRAFRVDETPLQTRLGKNEELALHGDVEGVEQTTEQGTFLPFQNQNARVEAFLESSDRVTWSCRRIVDRGQFIIRSGLCPAAGYPG